MIEEAYYRLYGQRIMRTHPMTVPRFMGSGPASAISLAFGITGNRLVRVQRLFLGVSRHRRGSPDDQGRTRQGCHHRRDKEASLTFGHIMAWQQLGAAARDTCRPFL